MSVSAAIRRMLDAGLSIEQALIAAEAFEADMPVSKPERSKAALRQERYRRNKASQNVTRDGGDDLSSPSGSSPKPLSPNPHQSIPPSPPKGGSSPTAKSELEAVLDTEHAEAVIQHRQKIRKPLTAHAAKLLAAKFAHCPNPNDAADAMVSNGWQGFEIGWMENRTASRRQSQAPPGRERTIFDAIDDFTGKNDHELPAGKTIDHDDGGDYPPHVHVLAAPQGR